MTKQQASETMKRLLLKCEQGAAWTDSDVRDFLMANSVGKRQAVSFAETTPDDGPLREVVVKLVVGHETFRDALRAYLTERGRLLGGD